MHNSTVHAQSEDQAVDYDLYYEVNTHRPRPLRDGGPPAGAEGLIVEHILDATATVFVRV